MNRLRQMDTDLVQKKIEGFIFRMNSRNKSFDMKVTGRLRTDQLVIVAGEKNKSPQCNKCHGIENIGDYSTHFFYCYVCKRKFQKPNRKKCKIHQGSLIPCSYCKWSARK